MMGMTLDDHGCAEPYSRGKAFLKQDVGHMRKIREHEYSEARMEALLELAKQALVDGNKKERTTIAKQIDALLGQRRDAA